METKKVSRHVINAITYLQASKTDFVHIEEIQDRVRRTLRHTQPVSNLEYKVKDMLRQQTEFGIVIRSGSSMYAIARSLYGIIQDETFEQSDDSLTADEIVEVRKLLSRVKKPVDTAKAPRTSFKKKIQNMFVRAKNPTASSTPIICDQCSVNIENFDIPKKVNRHVFKAMKHLSEQEDCKFIPLDKIKMEVKCSMKNLNPVKDLETAIERSLTNLSSIKVFSERLGCYRLNRVPSLDPVSSFTIFGKVSKTFFPEAPKDEPISNNSHVSIDVHASQDTHTSSTNLGGELAMDLNIRPVEDVFGTAPSVGNDSSTELGVGSFNASLVAIELQCQETQTADESPNISHMNSNELLLDELRPEETTSKNLAEAVSSIELGVGSSHAPLVDSERVFQDNASQKMGPLSINIEASEEVCGEKTILENAYSIKLGSSSFQVSLVSSENNIQAADESENISYMNASELSLDEPMQEKSSTCGREEPNVENVSSIELGGGPCHALLGSESISQCADENSSTQETYNSQADCEMVSEAISQDLGVSFSPEWLEIISNEPSTLFLRPGDAEAEKSSSRH